MCSKLKNFDIILVWEYIMPFVYRLQKVLDFRIRKKEEQLLNVQKAQQQVYIAEENIRKNEAEIRQTIQNKKCVEEN